MFSVGYSFHAPLAFGPDLALGFEYELDELALDRAGAARRHDGELDGRPGAEPRFAQ